MSPLRGVLRAWGAGMEAATWLALVPGRILARRGGLPLATDLAERLGRSAPVAPPGRAPWLVHAVSAGEMAAASALVAEMARRDVGLRALLSTGTSAGRAVAESTRRRFPDVVTGVTYLPWDRPRAVERWLARAGVEAVAVVEAEIWPGLFEGARRAGIPLVLCSGRMTPGEARRYALVRPFLGPAFEVPGWIGVQSPEDVARFVGAGAPPDRVFLSGNLKWDAPPGGRPLPAAWEAVLGGDVVVAASTHAPEEEVLLEALRLVRSSVPGARLVLAPRRVSRAGSIAALARRDGHTTALLSDAPPAGWDVLVVDAFGYLPELYRRAGAAFVGGSLSRRGGHSPAEPALAGVPLLMGPSDENSRGEARRLETSGALFRVGGNDPARSAASALVALLSDPVAQARAREALGSAAAGLRGAAKAAVNALLGIVGPPAPPV